MRTRARIQVRRIDRVELGLLGDAKFFDYGPGYRLYVVKRGDAVVILLCVGDKRTQRADIAAARKLAKELSDVRKDRNEMGRYRTPQLG